MLVITIIVIVTLLALSLVLYSSRIQKSERYQATVVPLANIMDIGFVAMTPIIVHITGVFSPLTMLGLCVLGLVMGGVMRYNIRNFEPVMGEKGLLRDISNVAKWALIVASLVNVAYYLQLMGSAIIFPFNVGDGQTLVTIIAVGSLVALGAVGYFYGLDRLNERGNRITAFNLAAVTAIIVGFLAYNVVIAVQGDWSLRPYNPPRTTQSLRQILGFFALVQGFEASRYLTEEYSAARRIRTMRSAQIISTVAFVLFPASALLLFSQVFPQPTPEAVLEIAQVASPVLPWLALLLAIGSQSSASINAIASRSDVLVEVSNKRIPRRYTFPLLSVGAIVIVLVTDVLTAVAMASRVFAVFFAIQCLMALILAARDKQWPQAVGITLVGLAMAAIAIFGISS